MSILSTTEELLENILGAVQVGEFAVVQPLSMEHCCILGYLLSWKLLLAFFKASSSHVSEISVTALKKAITHRLDLSESLAAETFSRLNDVSNVSVPRHNYWVIMSRFSSPQTFLTPSECKERPHDVFVVQARWKVFSIVKMSVFFVCFQLRAQYSLHLKKSRSLHKLLLHLFRLMPESPSVPGQSAEPKTFFTESLSLSPGSMLKRSFVTVHLIIYNTLLQYLLVSGISFYSLINRFTRFKYINFKVYSFLMIAQL